VIFFMVYDIDIHKLNLGKLKNLKFLDEFYYYYYYYICIAMNA
jgi:hypothetical protein